jgi:hypothetical protein
VLLQALARTQLHLLRSAVRQDFERRDIAQQANVRACQAPHFRERLQASFTACSESDPALKKKAFQDWQEQLAQRVAVKCRLSSLSPETSKAYIRHRLKVAGAGREIFSEGVLDQIAQDSLGIPRLINTICDNVLLEGFLRKREKLDAELVKEVVRDLGVTG